MPKDDATTPARPQRPNQSMTSTSRDISFSYDAFTSNPVVSVARERAVGMAQSAREWLSPTMPDWRAPLSQLESLTTVMFNPLAAHPVYRSESMAKAMQLMHQQQLQQQRSSGSSSSSSASSSSSSISTKKQIAWPSSAVLLQAEIPESSAPLSLFQGFSAAYPSFTNGPAKKQRHKRKKQSGTPKSSAQKAATKASRSMAQLIAEREKRARESDRLEMQKASTTNEVLQLNLQIEELINKRKLLEAKWAKLESKDRHLRASIEEINDAMAAIEDEGRDDGSVRSRRGRSIKEEEESEEEMESGTCFKTFEGHDERILSLDFNHPQGIMVSSSMDGTVRVWDLHRSRCLGTLEGHTSLVRCLQLDNTRLITGSDDGTIKHWDLSAVAAPSPSSVSSFSVYSSEPSSPTLSAYTTTQDDIIPLPSECYLGAFEGHSAEVTALYADEDTAVSGSNDKTMKQWDLETRQCVLTLDVMWASKSAEGTNSWSSFDRWSLDSLQQSLFEPASDFVGALQFWNFALASGTLDGKIRMWDLRTGQTHRTLPGHNGPVTSLQFDEVHLVSGSTDKTIRIWDLRTGSVFDTLSYSGPVTSLQFDSGKIVSAGSTPSIDVYNRTSFQHNSLTGHTGAVNSVRFRKNVLASGGKDKVVKLWTL